MGFKTGLIICGVIFFLIFALPLGITSIILSQTEQNQCNYKDAMGLDIKQYLLGGGIASVVVACLFAGFGLTSFCLKEYAVIPLIIIAIINALFGLAWFVVGGIILFRSNIECIQQGSVIVIYALVLWGFSALSLFSS